MRVLAATTAGAGHFAGLLPFARACARAGHEVRVAAPASFARTVESAGLLHEPLADADPTALGAVLGQIPELSMQKADELVVREVFGHLNLDASVPGLSRVLDEWRPDVVLREPAELASYVVATDRGVPTVQTNIGLSVLDDRLAPLFVGCLEKIGSSGDGLLTAPRWTTVPPSFDVASTTMTGPMTAVREPGPDQARQQSLPQWWPGDADRPLVYVTFGSVAAGIGLFPAFYTRVLAQLAAVPARVLLTLGQAGDPAELGPVPPNVHVERWWPQREVLPHAAVVVGHGGFGTTQAALAAAVPQVVLPLFSFDQFVNAERVAAVGVGLALLDTTAHDRRASEIVPRGPMSTDRLAHVIVAVLEQNDHAHRAQELAREIDALPDMEVFLGSLPALCE